MCDHKNNSGFAVGLLLGGVVGAGAAFLFGTKKGKEIQNKIKKQYPEVVSQLEDTLSEVKESFDDKVEGGLSAARQIKDEVKKEIKQIKQIGAPKKRFVKNGRKL